MKKKTLKNKPQKPKFKRPLTPQEEDKLRQEKEETARQINIKARHSFIDELYKKYE